MKSDSKGPFWRFQTVPRELVLTRYSGDDLFWDHLWFPTVSVPTLKISHKDGKSFSTRMTLQLAARGRYKGGLGERKPCAKSQNLWSGYFIQNLVWGEGRKAGRDRQSPYPNISLIKSHQFNGTFSHFFIHTSSLETSLTILAFNNEFFFRISLTWRVGIIYFALIFLLCYRVISWTCHVWLLGL